MRPGLCNIAFVEKLLAGFNNSTAGQYKNQHRKVRPSASKREKESNTAGSSSSLSVSLSVSIQNSNKTPLAEPISEREQEVLRLIGEGMSNKAIAEHLHLSLATVKTHINHLYAKLEVDNRVQALARARFLNLN